MHINIIELRAFIVIAQKQNMLHDNTNNTILCSVCFVFLSVEF